MFLKNAWYAAGWAHEVEGDRLLARTILGEPLVLFQGPDGAPAALIDRCGHRFAPLSMGRREGGRLRCMYHGLVFDAAGTCVEGRAVTRHRRGRRCAASPQSCETS